MNFIFLPKLWLSVCCNQQIIKKWFFFDILMTKNLGVNLITRQMTPFFSSSLWLYRLRGETWHKKALVISFSPATSTTVGISPQNFLFVSFNPFTTLVQNFKFVPSGSPKLLNLNREHSSRKFFFRSNS